MGLYGAWCVWVCMEPGVYGSVLGQVCMGLYGTRCVWVCIGPGVYESV